MLLRIHAIGRKLLVVKNRGGNALAMIPVDCHPNFSFREHAERDLHSLQPLQKLHCAVKVGMSVIFQPGGHSTGMFNSTYCTCAQSVHDK